MKPDQSAIITVRNLTKRFKEVVAVDAISFGVNKREIFAFLGPNGAGKTTTIKMLITLLAPTGGEANIAGHSIIHDPADVRKVIGYVPQMLSVDGSLTAYENLMLMARLYDIPWRERGGRIAQILVFLKLEKYARSLVKMFSGGMIRKLEIGQAMIHHPPVLFLDEPTTGLDPVARQNVWEHLLELRDEFDTTIFFSTHNMEEADEMSDMVAILNAGKLAVIGRVPELKAKTGKPDATLEDAFIFFTGNSLQESGDFREIRKARQAARRLS
jgi:ABC-2 type transport system ATP-binding protein